MKKNRTFVLHEANRRPVAVFDHNEAAFHMVDPKLPQAMVDELAEQDLYRTVLARVAEKEQAVEVDVDEI